MPTSLSRIYIRSTLAYIGVRGWTQADLARRMGIDPPRLSRILSGKYSPSMETLELTAKALGVDVCQLLCASKKPGKKA